MAEYTNLTELPRIEDISIGNFIDGDVPSLVWGLNIPATVDAERLVINMSTLQRYQKIGAIGASVVLEYQGEQTEFTPGVGGINADGSAIATSAGTLNKADKSKSDVVDPIDIPPYAAKEFGKPVILHYLNKAEMAQNIGDIVRNQGQSREEAWAGQIDVSLRDSFRRGGKEHLVNRATKPRRYVDYLLLTWLGAGIGAEVFNGTPPLYVPLIFSALQGLSTISDAHRLKIHTGSAHLDEKRWSLFLGGHQSDRYVALNGLSRVSRLVSVRK